FICSTRLQWVRQRTSFIANFAPSEKISVNIDVGETYDCLGAQLSGFVAEFLFRQQKTGSWNPRIKY
ncbi:hypothetical protein TNCT_494611, partial [Trichonephila clavata]